MDDLTRLNEGMLPFAKLLGLTFVSAAPDKVVALNWTTVTGNRISGSGQVSSVQSRMTSGSGALAQAANQAVGPGMTTISFGQDPRITGWVISARVGVIVYLF